MPAASAWSASSAHSPPDSEIAAIRVPAGRPPLQAAAAPPPARAALERGGEDRGPAHRLEEEPDRLGSLVVREEREVVGGVGDRLRSRRHDAAEADAPAEREE